MRSNRIGNIIFAAAVCITFGLVKGEPPHSEQGRTIGTGRMGLPVWMQQPGETDQEYGWRVIRMTQPFPHIQDGDAPVGDPAGPADGPVEPCNC